MTARITLDRISPDAIKAVKATQHYIETSSIDARLRAMIELRASQINGCAYCVDMHSQQARHAGETQQRLDCLPVWRETSFYSERERAALAWTEAVTLISQTGAPDAVYEQVKQQFTEKELIDLTLTIAMINLWNRLSISFRNGPPARPG